FGIRWWPQIAATRQANRVARWEAQAIADADDGTVAWPSLAGGFFGVDDAGKPVLANPRGAALIVGPPGAGKTFSCIAASVAYAPAACVSTTIKTEVMAATAAIRQHKGRAYWFNPGGGDDEPAPNGVQQLKWSPLVDVGSWSAALAVAARLTGPFKPGAGAGGTGSGDHWTDKAESWLAVLLYAASLGGGLEQFAGWT
ncbi:type IV secretory system conjugative DNA transfer family protein, partial [Mycolicibacterium hippocampi]